MDQRGTYYFSRLKLNTKVYVKNLNLDIPVSSRDRFGLLR
ncbi:hypothetical protein FORC087_260 (plasmid) [Bacillus cereus]|nr:hypothetical protein FORC087_260 [Bacillus cereus]